LEQVEAQMISRAASPPTNIVDKSTSDILENFLAEAGLNG